MRRLVVFEQLTVDGYYCGLDGDLAWAHRVPQDEEWRAFAAENARGGGTLLFGRVTYEMMVSYWPTPQAARDNPTVAEGMNARPKVVFSRKLAGSTWANTRVVKDDMVGEVRRM